MNTFIYFETHIEASKFTADQQFSEADFQNANYLLLSPFVNINGMYNKQLSYNDVFNNIIILNQYWIDLSIYALGTDYTVDYFINNILRYLESTYNDSNK